MKNLYKRLNITSGATDEQVIRAINKTNNTKLKRDARHVLLNPDRKRVFNRCNNSLDRIGHLRANLGLKNSPNWALHDFSDYQFQSYRDRPVLDSVLDSNTNKAQANKSKSSKNTQRQKQSSNPQTKYVKGLLWVIAIVLIINLFSSYSNDNGSASENDSPDISTELDANTPEYSLPQNSETSEVANFLLYNTPETLPINGYTYNYTSKISVAPLEIKVPDNSSHYFVKLEDYITKETAFTIFIRSGQSADVNVPLGTYEMKYATGENWYGTEHLFGPSHLTQKFKADDTFRFFDEGDYYMGHTIELISQAGGNLETQSISDSEW